MYRITANQIKNLRKKTGSGIMDCKKALIESKGDFQKAIEILRINGKQIALSLSHRETNEGVLIAKVNREETQGVIIGLSCETDFVAKNSDFIQLANKFAEIAISCRNKDDLLNKFIGNLPIKEKLIEQTGVIGEKIDLCFFEKLSASFVSFYVHNGNKIASLVGLSSAPKGVQEVAKNLAMQVAAMNPIALNKKKLSPDILHKEKEIAKEQSRKEGKPENMIEKISQGKLNKFFAENLLLDQKFIKNNKLSVIEYVKKFNSNIQITDYKRLSFSGGKI